MTKIKYWNNDKLPEIVKSNKWQVVINRPESDDLEVNAEFIFRPKKVK
jgi:hypothetical protein